MSPYRSGLEREIFYKYNELLEKFIEIWGKVRNSMKKEFDSEPVYKKKNLKIKINLYH